MSLGLLRRIGFLWGVVCCLAAAMANPTLVPPGNVSGVWIPANSPYVIKHGNITVPNGSSLFILAGVQVIFEGHYKFIVNGHLRAVGSPTDSVVFTGVDHDALIGWKGLRLIGSDSTQFDYCVFENGNAILGSSTDSTGGVVLVSGSGSRVVFNHCSFRNNYAGGNGGALFVSNGTAAECYDCYFSGNSTNQDGGAAFVHNSALSRFERCEFFNNRSGKEAGAIHSRFGSPVYWDCYFHHNVSHNSGGAVMASGQASFRRCVFERNASEISQGGALYFYDYRTTATLDSCIIQDNQTLLRDGGGAYCWEAAPRFTDCQFLRNRSSDDGGAVHCYRPGSNAVFTRCLFEGNHAADTGGGIIISNESLASLTDCVLRNNRSEIHGGGGIYIRLQSQPVFTNCIIENNSTAGYGGGVGSLESVPRFINCTIRGNTCDSLGGGIGAVSTEFEMTGCDISENHAHLNGGGLSMTLATPIITQCKIQNNVADSSGGGLHVVEALPTFTNCLLTGNTAAVQAGAGSYRMSHPTFVHCTIADNFSPVGNVFVVQDSPGEIINSIVATSDEAYGNGAPPPGIGILNGGSAWEIRKSLFSRIGMVPFVGAFQPGFGELVTTDENGTECDGYGNLFVAPRFVGSGIEPYALASTGLVSPALNTAPPFTVNDDLSGVARPQPTGSLPDIGCFEANQVLDESIIAGELSGTIQSGLHRIFGDIVVPHGSTLAIESGADLEFMGPYAILVFGELYVNGSPGDSVRMYSENAGNLLGWRGIRFGGTESSGSVISYFSASNAMAWSIDSSGGAFGFFDGASPTISNSHVSNCSSESGGAGLVFSGHPRFSSCTFTHCNASSGGAFRVGAGAGLDLTSSSLKFCTAVTGGAIAAEQGELELIDVRCISNSATDGGAIYLRNSELVLSYVRLDSNSATNNGGAVYSSNSVLQGDSLNARRNTAASGGVLYCANGTRGELSELTCKDNYATTAGGVMNSQGGTLALRSGLFDHNESNQRGGAFCLIGDSSSVVRGTLVRNSSPEGAAVYLENAHALISSCQITDNGAAVHFKSSSASRIEYSNFVRNAANFSYYQNNSGNGPANIGVINSSNILEYPCDSYFNVFVNPQYLNFVGGNYTIDENSACMDAGNPDTGCDSDLTFPEIGALHTPHSVNPWLPEELRAMPADSNSVRLTWKRSKAVRLCSVNELNFILEALNDQDEWLPIYSTTDTTCVLSIPELETFEQLRVRSSVQP
ncbi:MAG: right-handed parallel beta-helix repeat-containing protein [Calditrichaeota bacterium]|nr:right-handed parallel beta-helix repeat-containing protein [Calditrichota bacterium]MCB9368922.1 right-handed parallel beta-helix repeat-containing protein [Calditrichota bacterium]